VHSHNLALKAVLRRDGRRVYIILSAFWQPMDFEGATQVNQETRLSNRTPLEEINPQNVEATEPGTYYVRH
jgi:hypothetical protein